MKVRRFVMSSPNSIVCPACERGGIGGRGFGRIACDSCDRTFDHAILNTLRHIAALPDAAGKHACECGHPEMRLLPDGVFHCPACGSEVTPPGPPGGDAVESHHLLKANPSERKG